MLRYMAFVAVVLLTAVGWMTVLPAAPVRQPVAFNHADPGTTAGGGPGDGQAEDAAAANGQINPCHRFQPCPYPRHQRLRTNGRHRTGG